MDPKIASELSLRIPHLGIRMVIALTLPLPGWCTTRLLSIKVRGLRLTMFCMCCAGRTLPQSAGICATPGAGRQQIQDTPLSVLVNLLLGIVSAEVLS